MRVFGKLCALAAALTSLSMAQSVSLSIPALDQAGNAVQIGRFYATWGSFLANNGAFVQGGQTSSAITNGTIQVTLTASDNAGYVYNILVMNGSTPSTFQWKVPAAGATSMEQLNKPAPTTSTGPPGPQGPQGPIGPTGPTGPAGSGSPNALQAPATGSGFLTGASGSTATSAVAAGSINLSSFLNDSSFQTASQVAASIAALNLGSASTKPAAFFVADPGANGILNRTAAGTASVITAPAGPLADTTSAQTFTNKTITASQLSTADGSLDGDGIYLAPFFNNAGQVGNLFLSGDGKSFSQVGNSAVITGTNGYRDGCVWRIRNTWYAAYTNATLNTPQGTSFQIQSSPDLLNWTVLTNVSSASIPGATYTWAPEMVLNSNGTPYVDAGGHLYLTFSVSTVSATAGFSIYYVQSTDTTGTTWSAPTLLSNVNAIDPQLMNVGGTWYLWYSQIVSGQNFIEYATASALTGPFTQQTTGNWLGYGQSEAPSLVQTATGKWRMYHHLLANGDGINYSETSTFPTGWGATTAVVAPVAINHATVIRTQDLAAMRSLFAAKLQADAKGFQFPNPVNLPATVNIGATTGAATPRQTISLLSGGYAAPAGLNLSSNGDKLLLWNSGTFKAGIGINANDLWLQSQATDGKITLRTGNNLDSVDILGTGALQANFGATVGTAAQFQVSSAGIPKFGGTNTTGSNAAQLGSNCPAVSCSAPYTWIQVITADGSTAYMPVYK